MGRETGVTREGAERSCGTDPFDFKLLSHFEFDALIELLFEFPGDLNGARFAAAHLHCTGLMVRTPSSALGYESGLIWRVETHKCLKLGCAGIDNREERGFTKR